MDKKRISAVAERRNLVDSQVFMSHCQNSKWALSSFVRLQNLFSVELFSLAVLLSLAVSVHNSFSDSRCSSRSQWSGKCGTNISQEVFFSSVIDFKQRRWFVLMCLNYKLKKMAAIWRDFDLELIYYFRVWLETLGDSLFIYIFNAENNIMAAMWRHFDLELIYHFRVFPGEQK